MLFQKAAFVLLGLAAFTEAVSIREEARLLRRQNRGGSNNGNNGKGGNTGDQNAAKATDAAKATSTAKAAGTANNNGGNNNTAAATCLNAKAIQTGSQSDGQNPPVAGQSASATDNANFVNFCSGSTLTNGLQVKGGSCNGIVMGKIPSTSNMVSSIIISPAPAENIAANKDFTISVQTSGLSAGSFTNAAATYYAAPQNLASNGQIIGHTHVTVQDIGSSLTPTAALDANAFVFFKGINDAGNGKGLLSATVTGGLPAGKYRVCTMSSSSNHQPVLMPIAQRGAQDDCQKFTVGGNAANGSGSNGSNASSNAGGAAASSKAATATSKAASKSGKATKASKAARSATAIWNGA